MLSESYHIYVLNDKGEKLTFPIGMQPAKVSGTLSKERMAGAPTFTCELMYPVCLDDCWTMKEFVEIEGEKFYVKQVPSSSKDNEDGRYKHSITFVSERDILEYVFFFDCVTKDSTSQISDKPRSNTTDFSFYGDLKELVERLNDSLSYSNIYDKNGVNGFCIVIDDDVEIGEAKEVSISDAYFATAMQEIYNVFGIPYYWVGKICHVGYVQNEISTPFEYGKDNGLLSVSKNNSEYRLINRITGMGSADNIPLFYPNLDANGIAKFSTSNITNAELVTIQTSMLTAVVGSDYLMKEIVLSKNPASKKFSVGVMEAKRIDNKIQSNQNIYWSDCIIEFVCYLPKGTIIDVSSLNAVVKSTDTTKANIASSEVKKLCARYASKDGIETYAYDEIPVNKETDSEGYWQFQMVVAWKIASVKKLHNGGQGDKYYEWEYGPDYLNITTEGSFDIVYNNKEDFSLSVGDKVIPYSDSGIFIPNVTTQPCNSADNVLSKGEDGIYALETVVASTTANPATIVINSVTRIPVMSNLMPSVYRDTEGAERFYNALNEKYKDEEGSFYSFNNPYLPNEPLEGKQDFEDIKPTINGMTNSQGQLFGEVADIAFDDTDSDDLAIKDDESNSANLVHSYFYIKLHKFDGDHGFNLFKQGLAKGAMTFNFTSGSCAGCAFEVGVTKAMQVGNHYEFKNPVQVDELGNIVAGDYDDKVKEGNTIESQQDTATNEVWIALKKDQSTFGVVMPNATNNYKPKIGDKFVITNILLPQAYISAAEKRLEAAIIKYMSENNDEKFTFSIKFSRIYLQEHPEIEKLINENTKLHVAYNGKDYPLYVSGYTKKADGNVLEEISVELSEELTIAQSKSKEQMDSIMGNVNEQLGNIKNQIDNTQQGSSTDLTEIYNLLTTKLSKTSNDTAAGVITFLKGLVAIGTSRMDRLEVSNIIADIAKIYNLDADTLTANNAIIERLEVTGAAHFFQLIIDQVRSVGGRMILSAASCEAMHVEEMSGCHRVYFLADDGENGVTNNWQVNDLAICQSFNIGVGSYNDVSNKYYWRKVVGCSYNAKTYDFDGNDRQYYYIDLSNVGGEYDADSNAIPSAGDNLVQLGNSNNAERASAIIMSAYNDTWIDSELKAPSISQYIGIGISTSSQPFNFTLAPYRHTWFSLDSNEIRGKFRVVTSSGADKDVGEIVEEMANALDGDIQFWFYDYAPSLDNAPAAEWIAQGTADQHVGDIFYDTSRSGDFTGGTTFKFVKTDENAYAWQPVTDAQTLKSLQLIADAADDGIISGGSELSRLYLTWKEQQTLFNSITATADDSSQKRELNTSWTNLCCMLNDDTPLGDISTGLPSWFSDLSVDITLSEHTYDGNELDAVTYREMWNAYYTAYANLQKVVNEQINTRIDDNTTEIANTRAEFEVTTNSIRSEVDTFTTKVTTIEGTVGGINTTVTEQNTKIEQLSDRITSEVTERITTIEETVDGINTTVTQQNSKIEQLSGKITTEVTELTNKISTVNDRVDAQDGTIGTLQEEVGKIPLKTDADLTEYTGSIEVTSRKIALEVSEITDVRRNMLMGTQFWKNIGYDTDGYRVNGSGATLIRRTADTINGHNSLEISSSSTSNTYGGIYFGSIPVEAGKSYTISVWAKRMSSSLGNGVLMIVHYRANVDQGTPTWQESVDLVTTADTIGEWKLVTRTITPKSGDYYVNVIFCLVSSGTSRIAEPMMEESEEYTAWSPSPKDYAYVMGNMLPDTDTLKIVSSGEGLTQAYGRTADTDEAGIYMAKGTATATYEASSSSWTAGYRNLITMRKTFAKGYSYVLSFYARRTSAASDYAGLCVNFGSNVLIAEHSTGVSRFSEDQGSSPYSGYMKIKSVPNTWTRYWVHVITNDNVTLTPQIYIEVTGGTVDSSGNISGNTGTFLVKKPKLEYGAALTEWTTSTDDLAEEETIANQLHKTGINITKGLIELNAENTIIDGDLHLKGVLVENYAEPTDSLVICDLVQNKSVSVAHGSQVVLPMIADTVITRVSASETTEYTVNKVTEAGVKLTIAGKYNANVAKWATGTADLYTGSVMDTFHGYTTIVFADPRIASAGNYTASGATIAPDGQGGYAVANYKGGVFVCNGRRGRMLLMMPGQVLHLTSAIETIDGEKVLLWYVDNGSDYTPISKTIEMHGNEVCDVVFTTAGGGAWPMEVASSSGSEYQEALFAPKQLDDGIIYSGDATNLVVTLN